MNNYLWYTQGPEILFLTVMDILMTVLDKQKNTTAGLCMRKCCMNERGCGVWSKGEKRKTHERLRIETFDKI